MKQRHWANRYSTYIRLLLLCVDVAYFVFSIVLEEGSFALVSIGFEQCQRKVIRCMYQTPREWKVKKGKRLKFDTMFCVLFRCFIHFSVACFPFWLFFFIVFSFWMHSYSFSAFGIEVFLNVVRVASSSVLRGVEVVRMNWINIVLTGWLYRLYNFEGFIYCGVWFSLAV